MTPRTRAAGILIFWKSWRGRDDGIMQGSSFYDRGVDSTRCCLSFANRVPWLMVRSVNQIVSVVPRVDALGLWDVALE